IVRMARISQFSIDFPGSVMIQVSRRLRLSLLVLEYLRKYRSKSRYEKPAFTEPCCVYLHPMRPSFHRSVSTSWPGKSCRRKTISPRLFQGKSRVIAMEECLLRSHAGPRESRLT